MNTITFIISSFIIIVIPGTGVLYTISTGLSHGKKAGIFAALACTLGIIPHMCLSILLSSFMLHLGTHFFTIIKILGVCYLFYLGISMIVSQHIKKAPDAIKHTEADYSELSTFRFHINHYPVLSILRRGILINLLNPKLTLFFFSFLPQYINTSSSNYLLNSLLPGFLFMLITFLVFTGYGILAGYASRLLHHSDNLLCKLQTGFGILFLIFAIELGCSSI